jgi:CheY-like chemotaxis protein
LRIATEKRFDVIVLDLGLPRVSGIDVMHRLKSDERTRRVPIIVVTGYATTSMADVLRASGAAYVESS